MSDTIPKSEVARVLARAFKADVEPTLIRGDWEHGYAACVARIVSALSIRPEFESALAALEQEKAGRG